MDILKAIILGIIQGITEFLPVSSSGHLALFQKLLSFTEGGLFLDAVLHLGTLVAVIIVFRKTVWALVKAFVGLVGAIFTGKFSWKRADEAQRMLIMLIISLIPLFLVLIFKLDDYVEIVKNYTWAVGIALILNSIVLFLSDRFRKCDKTAKNMTVLDAVCIGAAQLIAIVPGISRSGSTITASVGRGLDREFAAKYSFILSIPTIIAGALFSFLDALEGESLDSSMLFPYGLGMLAAAVTGFFAIKLLQYILKSKKFFIFAIYCLAVGIFALVYGLINHI